jgi:hypothetical protein
MIPVKQNLIVNHTSFDLLFKPKTTMILNMADWIEQQILVFSF